MTRPVLLDLFCCQGGAAKGYQRAGFKVVGIDINPQPNYCGEMFIQGDVIEMLPKLNLSRVAAIHASPPCQGETVLQYVNDNRDAHPRLIVPTRELLQATGLPYVIENVVGAELLEAQRLCGEMFGLGVIRHRLFETNWDFIAPAHVKHRGRVRGWRHGTYYDGPYVAVYGEGGGKGTTAEWATALGIDWMTRDGLRESIPPAFTEFIGKQLIEHINRQKEAA